MPSNIVVGGTSEECGCVIRFVHGRLQSIRCPKHLAIFHAEVAKSIDILLREDKI